MRKYQIIILSGGIEIKYIVPATTYNILEPNGDGDTRTLVQFLDEEGQLVADYGVSEQHSFTIMRVE